MITDFKNNISLGLDELITDCIRENKNEILIQITVLITLSITQSCFSSTLKQGPVLHYHKTEI